MLGEGGKDVALMLAVPALGVVRSNHQAACRAALQPDRYRHSRTEWLLPMHAGGAWQVLLVLGNAQPVLADRSASDAVTGGLAVEADFRVGREAGTRSCHGEGGIRFVDELHHHDIVTQELGDAGGDCVQDLGEQRPRTDLTLDRGQSLQ